MGSGSMLGVAGAPPWAYWPVYPRVVALARVYVQMRGRSGFTAGLQRPPREEAENGSSPIWHLKRSDAATVHTRTDADV